MTYGRLKSMLKVLLIGDNIPPKDDNDMIAALEMAYIETANKTTELKLLTVNPDNAIMRSAPGNNYVRIPDLPNSDNEELDVDSELVPAVARIMASYVSKNKGAEHRALAHEIITLYESKVRVFLLQQDQRNEYTADPQDTGTISDKMGYV